MRLTGRWLVEHQEGTAKSQGCLHELPAESLEMRGRWIPGLRNELGGQAGGA